MILMIRTEKQVAEVLDRCAFCVSLSLLSNWNLNLGQPHTIKGRQCCRWLRSERYSEKLVMQMRVTDLFIEREEQSNIPNNANQGQNLWRRHSVTNWIWWRDKNREMLFICYTKTNFIIHNSLYARFAPCNSHGASAADCRSEYAGAFNNLTRQCLFSTCPQLKWICLNFVSVLFMSSFDTPCFPLLPSEKVCHLKRRRLYPRINQHSFGVRIRTHLTLKCSEEKKEIPLHYYPFFLLLRSSKTHKR